ncbi:NAD(P)-dependent oxidoreductase [Streptomyces avermitilis]|uniref:NAD(P)-dependent oxidoreductase n=1 Tax=Streptomyces avermitilis TaxID=33903 RepID=UPI003F53FE93
MPQAFHVPPRTGMCAAPGTWDRGGARRKSFIGRPRRSRFRRRRCVARSYDLEGMRVGTVAAGRVGPAVLRRLAPFDVKLHCTDRHCTDRHRLGLQDAVTAVAAPWRPTPRLKRRSSSSAVVARPMSRPSQMPTVSQPAAKPRSAAAGRPTSQ